MEISLENLFADIGAKRVEYVHKPLAQAEVSISFLVLSLIKLYTNNDRNI